MLFCNKKGFSLTEIIVASVLLSTVTSMFLAIILSTNRILERSNRRVFAAELAQYVLENLRANISDSDWNNSDSPIYPGTHPTAKECQKCINNWVDLDTDGNEFLDAGRNYFGWSDFAYAYNGRWQYNVIGYPGCVECRQVEVRVAWDE